MKKTITSGTLWHGCFLSSVVDASNLSVQQLLVLKQPQPSCCEEQRPQDRLDAPLERHSQPGPAETIEVIAVTTTRTVTKKRVIVDLGATVLYN